MPEIKHYIITQTREVTVDANNQVDALMIAEAAFDAANISKSGSAAGEFGFWGHTTSDVRLIDENVTQRRHK